jgi:alpha-beta hydrolase superfamily lysophospholipase
VVVVGVEMGAALAAGAVVTLAADVAAVVATGVAAGLAAGGALLELPQAARATLRKRAAGASQRVLLKDTGHASIRAGRTPGPPKRR